MDWRPQTQGDYLKADAKAKRIKQAGGTRARLPYVKLTRKTAFNWDTTVRPLVWDNEVDGTAVAGTGLSYAAGVFTVQREGLWEFTARAMIGTGNTFANTVWRVNNVFDISTGGAASTVANTSHGSTLIRRCAIGDVIAFCIAAGGTVSGPLVNNGPSNWLTARMLEK